MTIVSIRLFIRLFLGLVLASTGTAKFLHRHNFQKKIEEYQLTPSLRQLKLPIVIWLASAIPSAELIAGCGLISGLLLFPATLLAMGLISLFSVAILINLLRGRSDLSCHCGGTLGNHRISWGLILRNSLFIGSLFVLLLTPSDTVTFDNFTRHPGLLRALLFDTVLPVTLCVIGALAILALINSVHLLWRSH